MAMALDVGDCACSIPQVPMVRATRRCNEAARMPLNDSCHARIEAEAPGGNKRSFSTQKRREDARALLKLSRNPNRASGEFRTECFWTAMRPRIAFMICRKACLRDDR